MSADKIKESFVAKFKEVGEDKFYKYLCSYAMSKVSDIESNKLSGTSPEIEMLNTYEMFLTFYRREGHDVYLTIAKIFRKVAHKIYRVLIRKHLISKNIKFINQVK